MPVIMPEHDHAVVCYYPMNYKDEYSTALAMVTSHLLAPVFFQEMRTEKQYGYLVNIGYIPINRYPGIGFYIQSPQTAPIELVNAIDAFIEQMPAQIGYIPPEHWHTFKQGLITQLKEKDTSLRTKSQRFWASICNQDIDFNRKQKLIDIIEQLLIKDVQAFAANQLTLNTEHKYKARLTLASQADKHQPINWQDRASLQLTSEQLNTQQFKHKY